MSAFASAQIASPDWTQRYSAVVSLFVIVESCHEEMLPVLGEMAAQIRPLLMDEVCAVCKKASFWFSEVCDNESEALFEDAPWLMQDIFSVGDEAESEAQMIQSERKWLVESGLTMLECVGISYGEMDPDGVIILVVSGVGER